MAEVPPSASKTVDTPMDFIHLALDEVVYVKCRWGRELKGKLIVCI